MFRTVLGEAFLVAVAGVALALVANTLSPRGLTLSRDYFLISADNSVTNQSAALNLTNDAPEISATTNLLIANAPALAPELISVPRLAEKGLQTINSAQALRFFHDSRRENQRLIFIDARSEENYRLGHIPAAYELDPYHSEEYLPKVLLICQRAEVIVVYCTGSDCEDSELAALLLRKAGIPNQKLFVYVGGITEWMENQFPVETGNRPNAKPPEVSQ